MSKFQEQIEMKYLLSPYISMNTKFAHLVISTFALFPNPNGLHHAQSHGHCYTQKVPRKLNLSTNEI